MAPKRKLDRYVSSFVDAAGKERFRFRKGRVSIYLPPPGSAEYRQAYEQALSGVGIIARAKPRTINDLVSRFYQTIAFQRASATWQKNMRQVIEPFREKAGDHKVADYRTPHIDKVLQERFAQRIIGGKKFGGSASAERLREMLKRLFDMAIGLGWITLNPVDRAERVNHKGKGYYAWTEADVAKYRDHWDLGTPARLAMELMLWTGARRGNAHAMRPPENGRIRAVAVKTGKDIDLPVAPALQEAIDAMPKGSTGETLVVTGFGKPYSAAGFSNKMREWCDKAGLPHCTAHGLRKALARRASESNVHQQGMKALGQWSQDREVAVYAESANRKRLAEDALAAVIAWEQAANIG